jgi:ATP-dependent RNA helicase DDX49/DBP8
MAAQKAPAGSAEIKQLSSEHPDSSLQSDPFEESPGNSSDSDSDSDSDSLDSQGSRKRRKISPIETNDVDEDEDDDIPRIPISAAPSRIKSRVSKNAVEIERSNGGVLAPTDPQTSFASLTVKPWLVRSLENMAIKRPTGIQKGCIPEILKGKDCIGGSRTGSGKTVAFAVPILQKWAEDPFGIFALVLTPTRYGF